MSGPDAVAVLRSRREDLVGDRRVGGAAFGGALAAILDDAVRSAFATVRRPDLAVLALGSYARRELCPGSDVDVLLLHDGSAAIGAVADALWYPLWDAGFVLGHATRTLRESLRLAERNLDTLTALFEPRLVVGSATVADEVVTRARRFAVRRRDATIARLADAATIRRLHPGPIAEMLAPDLKEGAGGLRDLQALDWAGWCLRAPGGLDALVARGHLRGEDAVQLRDARQRLLEVRVALHRVGPGGSDVLTLEDQDAVALALAIPDADRLMQALTSVGRASAWLAEETWNELRRSAGRRRFRARDIRIDDGMVLRNGRLHVTEGVELDGSTLVRVARVAAETRSPPSRDALVELARAPAVEWTAATRRDFVAWLRTGTAAVDVFTALDHENLMLRILPEWAPVRSRPQRNAYHRFTVDRHLVETVAEAARLLDGVDGPIPEAVRILERPDLLLLGALLHDLAKGMPGDHARTGAESARTVAARMGLSRPDAEVLGWLVRDHLLMAHTATRRDLSDPVTIERFAERVGDPGRLALLSLLTVADSRATGPVAWGAAKAALVRELFDRTVARWSGHGTPATTPTPNELAELAGPGVAVVWSDRGDGRLRCRVGADDRPGLLADVAGALSLAGVDIQAAEGLSLPGNRAIETFDGTDRFLRLDDDAGRERTASTIREVLAGKIAVADALRERRAVYPSRSVSSGPDPVRVRVAPDESRDRTVVEVFAPDEIGLLATIAGVFGRLGLDVVSARVATTGELAVDVFYVRDGGSKLTDPARIARLDDVLRATLRRD